MPGGPDPLPDASKEMMWLGILSLILVFWYPLTFARELLTTAPSLAMRGPIAGLELVLHGAVGILCVAAGWSLNNRDTHGPALARLALVLVAGVTVPSLDWTLLPTQTPPGAELPLAITAMAHTGLWLVYLHRSVRVRAMEG